MKRASFFAAFIISASTRHASKSFLRLADWASSPMLVQTSVVMRSAPFAAFIGSANSS